MINMRLLLILLVTISISNVKTYGQGDFFENQIEILNNILLEGDFAELENYFKTQDSLFSTSPGLNDSEKIKEYNRIRNKYMSLTKKIKLISSKSQKEIKESYSHFIPIQSDYEKKLISENSLKAFKKFLFFYNSKNYSEAAKFINISFFLNFEEKSLLLDKFVKTNSQFSEELSELEESINCGDLEKSIYLENKLDSLIYFLPDSTIIIKERYLLLKEKLQEQRNVESTLLCSAEDLFFEPNFSINLGLFLDSSPENLIKLDSVDYFYEIPSNVGLGLSLSFNYQIVKSLYVGFEFGYFEHNYNYFGVFTGYYDENNIPYRNSSDIYGFRDLNISSKFYNLYLQYNFVNKTIFHPFVRLNYGKVFTTQTVSESNINYSEVIYNEINNVQYSYDEFIYGVGIEILRYLADNFKISVLYSRKIRYNDELRDQSSGRFEVILGYYW